MKKLNPEYLIGIGLIVACIGGIFFDASSDIGLGITLLGSSTAILGCVIGLIQRNKSQIMKKHKFGQGFEKLSKNQTFLFGMSIGFMLGGVFMMVVIG